MLALPSASYSHLNVYLVFWLQFLVPRWDNYKSYLHFGCYSKNYDLVVWDVAAEFLGKIYFYYILQRDLAGNWTIDFYSGESFEYFQFVLCTFFQTKQMWELMFMLFPNFAHDSCFDLLWDINLILLNSSRFSAVSLRQKLLSNLFLFLIYFWHFLSTQWRWTYFLRGLYYGMGWDDASITELVIV